MAIPRPVTKTKIATVSWGIPMTDEVNRLTTEGGSNITRIAALETKTTPTAWTTMTLQNGFVGSSSGGRIPGARWRAVNGFVTVSVQVANGSANTPICTMPVGYRSPGTLDFIGRDTSGAAMFNINADGTIVWYGLAGNNTLIGLNASFYNT